MKNKENEFKAEFRACLNQTGMKLIWNLGMWLSTIIILLLSLSISPRPLHRRSPRGARDAMEATASITARKFRARPTAVHPREQAARVHFVLGWF